ncbi:MAG: phosphate acyltransferase PlsX [Gammaproteobacteria bacterium]|nr:phosphate acyltransferase PlsX [Gammaproteobacteria bacterium]
MMTIAVDAMGGDNGPPVVVPAALQVLIRHDNLVLILVGDESILQQQLLIHNKNNSIDPSRLIIRHTTQHVEMGESPALALRTKKDSSMRVAINLVKEEKAQACVSAGNTGALMATARFVLKTLPGIDRPAIISSFPTIAENKDMRMLDLGANVDSNAELLFQFAVMGSVLASAIDNIKNPKIYLLNIGVEDIKGNEQVKQAAQLLSQSPGINYQGYIEGDEIYKGEADIVVCDGFVGNVALKTTEGVAKFVGRFLKKAFARNILTKLAGLIALPVLKSLAKVIDPERYNGACFIGLKGIVIKSHGGASINAFSYAIEEAIRQVEHNIPYRIGAEVERLLTYAASNKEANNSIKK